MATYLGRIQLLAKPASEWAASDPVLMLGEVGVMDAGSSAPVLKVGDGARVFSLLPTITGSGGGGGATDYVAGPTTTLPPGSPATVVIDNASDPPTISFGIPQGVAGPAGSTGATGPAGSDGATGPAGPANSLTIGTVTTGAAGSPASATITGTPPNQVLSLTIPQGAEGPQGPQGVQGVKGDTGAQGPAGAGSTPGNRTQSAGLAAVNGIAPTFARSDSAPAIDQAIAPTWGEKHVFGKVWSNGSGNYGAEISSAFPTLAFRDTAAGLNAKVWFIGAVGNTLFFNTAFDANGSNHSALVFTRAAENVTTINFPNGQLQYGGQEVGFRGLSVAAVTAPYTLLQTDNGRCVEVGNTGTVTLPVLTEGTLVTVLNVSGAAVVSLTPSSGTLYWLNGTSTIGTGTRTLAGGGVATVVKRFANWYIWGMGLS